MKPVARLGDKISHGGQIITASDDTTADGIKVARVGDKAACAKHGTVTIVTGAGALTTNNKLTARIGDKTSCGATIVTGSSQRVIGDDTGSASDTPAPSAAFTKPPDYPVKVDPATEKKNNASHAAYIANPSASRNPVAAENGVKESYAGTPDTSGQIDPPGPPKKCSKGHEATVINFLNKILEESAKGMWRESGQGGRPSNPNILGIWKSIGYPSTGIWTSDQTAWCAGFVNVALKESGLPYAQEAGARNMINVRGPQLGFVKVPISDMQPGDIVLWNFSHVNFCYTANGGKYTFVGGNQTPEGTSRKNNPDDGSVTISWKSGWTPARGGIEAVIRPQCK
jgi:uncharacterized Zn-binding protein involved in type VI secretion